MRTLLKWMGITLAISIVVLILSVAFSFIRPDLKLNPYVQGIHAETRAFQNRVDLTPKTIEVGAKYSDVKARLNRYGFEGNIAGSYVVMIKKDSNIACNLEYIVELKLDEEKRVETAEGFVRERGCL